MNRERRLHESFKLVVAAMELRGPQIEALRRVRDVLLLLPVPLGEVSADVARSFLSREGEWVQPYHPTFTLSLATGVGKSRLAGAIIAMLWLAGESKTFLLLAPRRAVMRRLAAALDPQFREYLFVDPNLVPEPYVVRADDLQTPRATDFGEENGPVIFLVSQQIITNSDRFLAKSEFSDVSPASALRSARDLVVIADEAHHVGRVADAESTAWASAIRDLGPALQLGLTATPRKSGDGAERGVNILYDYPLAEALRDGLYTKRVKLLVRQFGETWEEDDIERATLAFTLERLETKKRAVAAVDQASFPRVKPVVVFFAKDTTHANQIRQRLIDGFSVPDESILLTHSRMSKNDEELERLLSIEKADNPVEIVVNVMELVEGWDVTNVYVVAPLRQMGTFAGAVQAMGRGLRLPAGHRIGDVEADTLDVVCFGKTALEQIVRDATEWSGRPTPEAAGLDVRPYDKPGTVARRIAISAIRPTSLNCRELEFRRTELKLELEPEALSRVATTVVQGLELAAAQIRLGSAGRVRLSRERFVEAASQRVIRRLGGLLSDVDHLQPVRILIAKWLDTTRPDTGLIDFDPQEVGEEVAETLVRAAKSERAEYLTTNREHQIDFGDFTLTVEVPAADSEAPIEMPAVSPASFIRGWPYDCWQASVHEAYSFDSLPEAQFAILLDQWDRTRWWLRNQPRRLRIPTPAGVYSPDFIAAVVSSSDSTVSSVALFEVKADYMWQPPDGLANLKAAAARKWCEEQSACEGVKWTYHISLESDIDKVVSFAELAPRLIEPFDNS